MSFLYLLRLYSLVFALLLPISIVGEGFVAGTLVCTPQGHVPIEELSVGDEVITSDLNIYKVEPIIHVTRYVVKEYVRIQIKDTVINVAADHPFLFPCEQRWEQACKLTVRACLVGAPLNAEFIDSVEKVQQPSCVYTLSLAKHHTYLVSERNIMVHNNDATDTGLIFGIVQASGLLTSLVATSGFVPPVAIIAGGGTVIGLVVWSFVDGIRSARTSSRDDNSHTVTDSNVPSQNSSHNGSQNSGADIDRSPPVIGIGQFDGFENEARKLQKDTAADTRRREEVLREDVHEVSSSEQSHNNAQQEKEPKKKNLVESKQQRAVIVPPEDPKKNDNENDFFKVLKTRAKKAVRTKFGKMYQDPNTKLWWSRDVTNHGGSCYKVFKESSRGFEWQFDADRLGQIIVNKHKGPTGLFIPYKEVVFLP